MQGKNNVLAVSLIMVILASAGRISYINLIGCCSVFVDNFHVQPTTVNIICFWRNTIGFDKCCSVGLSGGLKCLATMHDLSRKVN
jgi:hypothetical protein